MRARKEIPVEGDPRPAQIEALEEKVADLLNTSSSANPATVTITDIVHKGKKALRVRIFCMYEKPKYKNGDSYLSGLVLLRDTLGAKDLETPYDFAISGCETCDYGSEYGWEFTAIME